MHVADILITASVGMTIAGLGRSSKRTSPAACSMAPRMTFSSFLRPRRRLPGTVLFVGDLLEPVDVLAVQRFLDRDVRHRGHGRRAMPVLLLGRDRDHVSGPDLLDGTFPALHQAEPRRNYQR